MRCRFTAAALVLLMAALPGTGAGDELEEGVFLEARKKARQLMGKPGSRPSKLGTIDTLGRDDSRRAAEVLLRWTLRSLKLQQGPLAKELAEAKKDFEKVDKLMRRFYEKLPPTRVEDKNAWDRVRRIHEAAQGRWNVENAVRFSLGEAFQRMRDPAAVSYLLEEGLPALQKARRSEEAQVAVVRGLLQQPRDRILPMALAMAADAKRVKLRILVLNWFGQHKIAAGFEALVAALSAQEVAVRRAALPALRALDDKRAVKPLIDAMKDASGLLRAEIDDVLHWFTGQSFEGSVSVWKRWWQREGATWLADESTRRHHRRREKLPGGTRVRFYGIPTESHHIVFVLDRSGSMKTKASDRSIEAKKKQKEPKGPVTGRGGKEGEKDERKGRDAVPGDTKIEVARNQLALSVDELAKGIQFAVIFYSNDVQVWRDPPDLMPSTKANRESAKAWFMKLEAVGSTQMFAALAKALEYADTIGEDEKKRRTGADTIFLLSDGSPTDASGKPLPGAEVERLYAAFTEANKLYRCTVHTIGIGPGHNSSLLRRLARDTGGQYKAVGTN